MSHVFFPSRLGSIPILIQDTFPCWPSQHPSHYFLKQLVCLARPHDILASFPAFSHQFGAELSHPLQCCLAILHHSHHSSHLPPSFSFNAMELCHRGYIPFHSLPIPPWSLPPPRRYWTLSWVSCLPSLPPFIPGAVRLSFPPLPPPHPLPGHSLLDLRSFGNIIIGPAMGDLSRGIGGPSMGYP